MRDVFVSTNLQRALRLLAEHPDADLTPLLDQLKPLAGEVILRARSSTACFCSAVTPVSGIGGWSNPQIFHQRGQ
jgi:hypothetical protein